ncbi:MAG: DinB family protein [Planctomycetota bacterium]
MKIDACLQQLKTTEHFLQNTLSCFAEKDSKFAPEEEMFTVAQHVAHVARVVDWFMAGMFDPKGFDMDFEKQTQETKKTKLLKIAKAQLAKSMENARNVLSEKTEKDLSKPLPEGPIMGNEPRYSIIGAIADHTAHHRGSLAVYARLLGKVPKMPYE